VKPRKQILKEQQTKTWILSLIATLSISRNISRDISRHISRKLHKVLSSHLFPLPTDFEETHEAFISVYVLTISKEHFSLLLITKILL